MNTHYELNVVKGSQCRLFGDIILGANIMSRNRGEDENPQKSIEAKTAKESTEESQAGKAQSVGRLLGLTL